MKNLNRRNFIKTTGATIAGVAIAPAISCSSSPYDSKGLPTTILGKTGVTIPKLVVGCGSRFMAIDEEKGLEILETAVNNGLYYWDTASTYIYNNQASEERLGKILKSRRNEIFLSTKTEERSGEKAKRIIEESLKKLQTDHIDLYQIHSINNVEEVRKFGDKDGILPVLQKYRNEGVIKHIGFTGHTTAAGMKLAAELYDFDTMLIALNHYHNGSEPMEESAVKYAAAKGMGVLAMKVIRPRETIAQLDPKELIRYALSLDGITAATIGIDNLEVLKTNIELIKNFNPLSDKRMKELHAELKPFYRHQNLPWMKPGYFDGLHLA